jgi:glucokinase
MYLGIEIGGTKLQLGVGPDDGNLRALWRGTVDPAAGARGIQRQLTAAVGELLSQAGLSREQVRGVGIGFGGPVDDSTHTVIKSHQIRGWNRFPLADWVSDLVGLPAVLGNDADVAGLAEALHGAGKGLSPIFYITIGSGIGGGLIIEGEIYRGAGRGAAEIGQMVFEGGDEGEFSLEHFASGWGIEESYREAADTTERVTVPEIARRAKTGDRHAAEVLHSARYLLAAALSQVVTLLCPRRIIIGGGVSLLGERELFRPLRKLVAERTFQPFRRLTDIVPPALGEEVVVHGAIALARKKLA